MEIVDPQKVKNTQERYKNPDNCFSLGSSDFVLMTTNLEVKRAYAKLFKREKQRWDSKTGVHRFHQYRKNS